MQNSNMIISIFMFYYQKKGIPSENPFLFRKEFKVKTILKTYKLYMKTLIYLISRIRYLILSVKGQKQSIYKASLCVLQCN